MKSCLTIKSEEMIIMKNKLLYIFLMTKDKTDKTDKSPHGIADRPFGLS